MANFDFFAGDTAEKGGGRVLDCFRRLHTRDVLRTRQYDEHMVPFALRKMPQTGFGKGDGDGTTRRRFRVVLRAIHVKLHSKGAKA